MHSGCIGTGGSGEGEGAGSGDGKRAPARAPPTSLLLWGRARAAATSAGIRIHARSTNGQSRAILGTGPPPAKILGRAISISAGRGCDGTIDAPLTLKHEDDCSRNGTYPRIDTVEETETAGTAAAADRSLQFPCFFRVPQPLGQFFRHRCDAAYCQPERPWRWCGPAHARRCRRRRTPCKVRAPCTAPPTRRRNPDARRSGRVYPRGSGRVYPRGSGRVYPRGSGRVYPRGSGRVYPRGGGRLQARSTCGGACACGPKGPTCLGGPREMKYSGVPPTCRRARWRSATARPAKSRQKTDDKGPGCTLRMNEDQARRPSARRLRARAAPPSSMAGRLSPGAPLAGFTASCRRPCGGPSSRAPQSRTRRLWAAS
jgi:hypothetical protein